MALHDWNFKLIVKTNDNTEVEQPYGSCKLAKRNGGKEFHKENVKRVTVFDTTGKVYLYLVAGHPEKTENVKSPY